MTTRTLPREEWAKAEAVQPGILQVVPGSLSLTVVEDDAGALLGMWGLVTLAHAEGFWIHPEHRKKGVVLRRLWRGFRELARTHGADAVITGAQTDDVKGMLEAVGAVPLPPQYVLPLTRKA